MLVNVTWHVQVSLFIILTKFGQHPSSYGWTMSNFMSFKMHMSPIIRSSNVICRSMSHDYAHDIHVLDILATPFTIPTKLGQDPSRYNWTKSNSNHQHVHVQKTGKFIQHLDRIRWRSFPQIYHYQAKTKLFMTVYMLGLLVWLTSQCKQPWTWQWCTSIPQTMTHGHDYDSARKKIIKLNLKSASSVQ